MSIFNNSEINWEIFIIIMVRWWETIANKNWVNKYRLYNHKWWFEVRLMSNNIHRRSVECSNNFKINY